MAKLNECCLDKASVLIWIQMVRHSDNVPERFVFEKVSFVKSQQTTRNKRMKNYPTLKSYLNVLEVGEQRAL